MGTILPLAARFGGLAKGTAAKCPEKGAEVRRLLMDRGLEYWEFAKNPLHRLINRLLEL